MAYCRIGIAAPAAKRKNAFSVPEKEAVVTMRRQLAMCGVLLFVGVSAAGTAQQPVTSPASRPETRELNLKAYTELMRSDLRGQPFNLRIHLSFNARVNVSIQSKARKHSKNYQHRKHQKVNISGSESIFWTSQDQLQKGPAENDQGNDEASDD